MKKMPASRSAPMPLLPAAPANAAEPMDVIFSDPPPLHHQADDAEGRPEMRGTAYQQVRAVLNATGLGGALPAPAHGACHQYETQWRAAGLRHGLVQDARAQAVRPNL